MAAMNPGPANPYGELVFADDSNKSRLSRMRKAGGAVQLAPAIYVTGSTVPVEALAKHYARSIAAHYWPGAVISDRSALAGGPSDGWLFLSHPHPPRRADVVLPGLTISCRMGPGALPGDMPMPEDICLASPARMLLENAEPTGRPAVNRPNRAAGMGAVGDKIAELAASDKLSATFAVFDQIRGRFSPAAANRVAALLAAAGGTHKGAPIESDRLAAHVAGTPYDTARLGIFDNAFAELGSMAPVVRPAVGRDEDARRWLTFFEAYFSNYIEGTKFSVEEAKDIAINGIEPPNRPQDAHDVSATYSIVNDPALMSHTPRDADDFLELLADRHRYLMAARPDKNPGVWKTEPNYAGATEFVHPDHVPGTLREGWDRIAATVDPFHRAVMTMLVVTECHPFDDGNGRLARIMTNAELVATKQQRIIIPTCFRNNYLASLNGATNYGGVAGLVSVLDFARKWVSAVDWSDWDRCMADLNASNAFEDPGVAEHSGRRLRMPGAPGIS